MPIDVTCPGCKTRFKVSEKFGGRKGPCPKCKAVIQIPTADEQVVVHTPDEYGPKSASGQGVLKPIFRTETVVTPIMWVVIGGSVLLTLTAAVVLRFQESVSEVVVGAGAVILAPMLAFAGYSFLRDDELEPYYGKSLWIRVSICAFVYFLLWVGIRWLPELAFDLDSLEMFHLLVLAPPVIAAGAAAAYFTFDLDISNSVIHYCLYLLVTIVLRLIMGLPLIPGFQAAGAA